MPKAGRGSGVPKVSQAALGVNTQEPDLVGSGKTGSKRKGHWGAQCPWLGPQVMGLRFVT